MVLTLLPGVMMPLTRGCSLDALESVRAHILNYRRFVCVFLVVVYFSRVRAITRQIRIIVREGRNSSFFPAIHEMNDECFGA